MHKEFDTILCSDDLMTGFESYARTESKHNLTITTLGNDYKTISVNGDYSYLRIFGSSKDL